MISVQVTQRHIDESGRTPNPIGVGFNPLAMAICDALDEPRGSVRVSADEVDHIGVQKAPLPEEARSALLTWKGQQHMVPFSFNVDGLKKKTRKKPW